MVEEERHVTQLDEQDDDSVRRALALEDAILQLYPSEISYELLSERVITGKVGTRVEDNPHRNIQAIAKVSADWQGSLGGGTPRNPLRIGKRSTAR